MDYLINCPISDINLLIVSIEGFTNIIPVNRIPMQGNIAVGDPTRVYINVRVSDNTIPVFPVSALITDPIISDQLLGSWL